MQSNNAQNQAMEKLQTDTADWEISQLTNQTVCQLLSLANSSLLQLIRVVGRIADLSS